MTIEVTDLKEADIPGAVKAVQQAFSGDPYNVWVYDQSKFNQQRNYESLALRMRWGMRNGIFHVAKEQGSDEVLGVAMWLPPQPADAPPTWNDWFEGWRLWFGQVNYNLWYGRGGLNVKRYYIWKEAQARAQREIWTDPRGYYFLNIMVVLPSAQGKGVGAKMMKAVTGRADEEGVKCYLESSKDVPNVKIYGRWGFVFEREMICDDEGDAIRLFTMTKCDERKPGCARCEERGIQCPGYALNVRWSRKHQVRVDQKAAAEGSPRQRGPREPASQTSPQPIEAASPTSNHVDTNVLQHVDPWLANPLQWDLPALPQEMPSLDASSCALLLSSQNVIPTTPFWDAPFISSAWTVDGHSPTTSSSQAEDREMDHLFQSESSVANVQENSIPPPFDNTQSTSCKQFLESSPRELAHLPTSLSEYFFREVITLYCAWDSKTNVMRNIVETMWQSSGALYHTIQSMAAACLSEDFPHLLPVARREHGNALRLIRDRPSALLLSTSMTTTHKRAMLLSSTLLGHTSSWLSPQNLATDMFRASCSMLKDVSAEACGSDADASLSFFSDTMDYWAMLLAYLTDSTQLGDYHHTTSIGPADPSKSIEPHPYSGISHATVRLLTDTGILIFQYRKHMASVKFLTETDLDVFRAALRSARQLERAFLAHRPPDLSRVTDPGDPKTPLRHLELIDEAYRCTGLLQLYRVFPDLLNERYAPWDRERLLRPVPISAAAGSGLDSDKVPSARERRTWLTKLAMYILGILRDIPFESRTRSAQPFIMVAISSELRREPQHLRQPDAMYGEAGADVLDIDPASIEVARARKFVRSRLAAYTHILPLRKSRVISELIDHTWAALDAGEEDVYWLDIAREKNLGTMMG
ncbi:hypothetical protein CABS01_02776 [Colletotrichum abscissum]|uniref:uncharacterized protein n=1 Tax=Colletotrichum abscissum TaxID=1671311 RepID=UPI0027D55B4F|nr:uncharacterized protein CABS01_02776 [Colletotrichum abscissum]KAK1483040.1 hypothetical protein CABS01_02776 [Colletotrichum abscissum]